MVKITKIVNVAGLAKIEKKRKRAKNSNMAKFNKILITAKVNKNAKIARTAY